MQCLVKLGAEVGAKDVDGDTALLTSELHGMFATAHWLREHTDVDIADVDKDGWTFWVSLAHELKFSADINLEALTALLRVVVLRAAPPTVLVALFWH
jgi:ankyrin repeat protein